MEMQGERGVEPSLLLCCGRVGAVVTPLDVSEAYFEADGPGRPWPCSENPERTDSTVGADLSVMRDRTAAGLLLDDVGSFLRRFVVMSDRQVDAVVLWVAHTHGVGAAEVTPYLVVTSAEKRSGKTRLREALELVVHVPLPAANISDAALFRAIASLSPTLLLDEADAVFRAREREDLRGLLNAGYRRGAVAYRMGGANRSALESFPVFCAKGFFGIGDFLPDTLADRAIPIRLQRRMRDEQVDRFRRREVEPEGYRLRDRLADWLQPQLEHLYSARPVLPEELDDRAADSWEPLLAIADLAGGDWPARARQAALSLSTGEEREDDSLTARLLGDIHAVFRDSGEGRLRTAELLDRLCRIEESPWGDWYGKTLSANTLSKLLKPYRIKTIPIRRDGEVARGYKAEQFEDAWIRVLGVTRVTGVTPKSASQAEGNARNACNAQTRATAPIIGDQAYLDLLDRAHTSGHVTDRERRKRRRIHFAIRGTGLTAA
jgi:hypothetical protein